MDTQTENLVLIRELLEKHIEGERDRRNLGAILKGIAALLATIFLVAMGGDLVDLIARRAERARVSVWKEALEKAGLKADQELRRDPLDWRTYDRE